jgi:hypothetical protein
MSENNMEDTELDELLDRWDVPPAPVELREKVRRAFPTRRKRRYFSFNLKPMFAGTAIGVGLGTLLLITQAFPQTLQFASPLFRIPFTVESEFVNYDEHGTGKVDIYSTTYTENGREILLSSSMPGQPVVTAIRRILEATGFVWYQIAGDKKAWPGWADWVRSGCVLRGQAVVERTTILGYATVAVQGPDLERRATFWYAPDLDCFALKIRFEERQKDGSYRIVSEKHALAIERNRPNP